MLFDTAFAGARPDDVLSFIVEILESFTEYSIIGKDLNGRILLWIKLRTSRPVRAAICTYL